MEPWELFDVINQAEYKTIGDDLDYQVKEIEGRAVLIFQPSANIRDWINNFDFPAKVYKNQESAMRIHRGYGKVWKSGNDQIMSEFISMAQSLSDKPALIIGWSFGGAMSVLAAEDYHYRTKAIPIVITFGAPKVAANKKTRDYLYSIGAFYQYADNNDIVPRMPPLPWFHQIYRIGIGDKYNFFKMFNAAKYHTGYGDPNKYGGQE